MSGMRSDPYAEKVKQAIESKLDAARQILCDPDSSDMDLRASVKEYAALGWQEHVALIDRCLSVHAGKEPQTLALLRATRKAIGDRPSRIDGVVMKLLEFSRYKERRRHIHWIKVDQPGAAQEEARQPSGALLGLEGWRTSASDEELWSTLEDAPDDSERRAAALEEIIERQQEREDERLPAFILEELGRASLPRQWRDALVLATERVQFRDHGQRGRLAERLLALTLDMQRERAAPGSTGPRDAPADPLHAAIRRYAKLRPQARAEALLVFLSDDQPFEIRRVALVALSDAFSGLAPTLDEWPRLDALRRRAAEMVLTHLAPERVDSPDQEALALDAYCASAALAPPELPALTERAVAAGKPWLLELALGELTPTLARWRRGTTAEHPPEVIPRLEEAVVRLQAAVQASSDGEG